MLALINIDGNGLGALHHWPKPAFELETLQLDFENDEGSSFGLVEFGWLTDSSRNSLRHLTINPCGPEVVPNLARWGTNLRSLRFEQYCYFTVTDLRREFFSRTASMIRVGRREDLNKLELVIRARRNSTSEDACIAFEGEVRAAAQGVNNRRGREIVTVDLCWVQFP